MVRTTRVRLDRISSSTRNAHLAPEVIVGQDIIAAGSIPARDSYSFTSDRPWINHEWLSQVIFASIYAAGGVAGLLMLVVPAGAAAPNAGSSMSSV